MGGILGSLVTHPIKPCSFTRPLPGTGATVLTESGQEAKLGEVGELVMRCPPLGMTQGLWHDDARYIDSYWSRFPGVWHHGDFAMHDEDGFYYVLGRSDDTMNVAGKRTGPSEIEALILSCNDVKEAAAVGIDDPIKGTAIICVCVPVDDTIPTEQIADEVGAAIINGLGAPFKPKNIVFCADLPKTRNMKVMRRIVRALYRGEDLGDLSAMVNPDSIDALRRSLARAGVIG